jgi:hypothetical protein
MSWTCVLFLSLLDWVVFNFTAFLKKYLLKFEQENLSGFISTYFMLKRLRLSLHQCLG